MAHNSSSRLHASDYGNTRDPEGTGDVVSISSARRHGFPSTSAYDFTCEIKGPTRSDEIYRHVTLRKAWMANKHYNVRTGRNQFTLIVHPNGGSENPYDLVVPAKRYMTMQQMFDQMKVLIDAKLSTHSAGTVAVTELTEGTSATKVKRMLITFTVGTSGDLYSIYANENTGADLIAMWGFSQWENVKNGYTHSSFPTKATTFTGDSLMDLSHLRLAQMHTNLGDGRLGGRLCTITAVGGTATGHLMQCTPANPIKNAFKMRAKTLVHVWITDEKGYKFEGDAHEEVGLEIMFVNLHHQRDDPYAAHVSKRRRVGAY